MKICLISNLYAPHIRGGAERVVRQLARDLSARGHDVHVITSVPFREVGFGSTQHLEHGVKVHRLFHWCFYFNLTSGHQPFFLRALNLMWSHINIPFAWHALVEIKKINPEIVHTHNLSGTSFLLPMFLHTAGIKYIHTLHDIQLAIPSGRLEVGEEFDFINASFFTRGFQFLQRALWGNPKIVTAPSAWLLEFYKRKKYFRHSRLQTVRHYFGSPVAAPTEFPFAHVSRTKFTYLFVGQIEKAKGALILISIFSDLFSRGELPDCELIIVGIGTDRIEAETIASPCAAIQLVGELDSSRVAHMMRAADIIVVPSMLYENSPSVVVEALALGRPVSVSDIGGAAELVRENDGGWVVEPTEDAWRAHILWLFKNQNSVVQRIPLLDLPNATAEFEKLYLL